MKIRIWEACANEVGVPVVVPLLSVAFTQQHGMLILQSSFQVCAMPRELQGVQLSCLCMHELMNTCREVSSSKLTSLKAKFVDGRVCE